MFVFLFVCFVFCAGFDWFWFGPSDFQRLSWKFLYHHTSMTGPSIHLFFFPLLRMCVWVCMSAVCSQSEVLFLFCFFSPFTNWPFREGLCAQCSGSVMEHVYVCVHAGQRAIQKKTKKTILNWGLRMLLVRGAKGNEAIFCCQ